MGTAKSGGDILKPKGMYSGGEYPSTPGLNTVAHEETASKSDGPCPKLFLPTDRVADQHGETHYAAFFQVIEVREIFGVPLYPHM